MQILRGSGHDHPGPALRWIGKKTGQCSHRSAFVGSDFEVPPSTTTPHWSGNQCSIAVTWQERGRSRVEMKTSWGSFQKTIPGMGVLKPTIYRTSLGSSCGPLEKPKEDRQCLRHNILRVGSQALKPPTQPGKLAQKFTNYSSPQYNIFFKSLSNFTLSWLQDHLPSFQKRRTEKILEFPSWRLSALLKSSVKATLRHPNALLLLIEIRERKCRSLARKCGKGILKFRMLKGSSGPPS